MGVSGGGPPHARATDCWSTRVRSRSRSAGAARGSCQPARGSAGPPQRRCRRRSPQWPAPAYQTWVAAAAPDAFLDADASWVEPASIGRAPVGPVSVGPAPAGPASVESGSAEPALADPALAEPASDGPASVLAVSAAAVVTGSRPEVRGLGGALVVDVPASRSAGRSGGSPSPPTSCRIPAPDPKPASTIQADDRASEHVSSTGSVRGGTHLVGVGGRRDGRGVTG